MRNHSPNKQRATIIIHSYAEAASFWERKVSSIPVIGTLGVMVGSDLQPVMAINIGMLMELGRLYERSFAQQTLLLYAGHVIGSLLGIPWIRGAISVVPILGKKINANLVLEVTEYVGWATFLMFEADQDLKQPRQNEFKPYILRGRDMAKDELRILANILASMPPETRTEYDELVKQIYKTISSTKRMEIIDAITELLAPFQDDRTDDNTNTASTRTSSSRTMTSIPLSEVS